MADNRINIVISAKDQASGPLRDVSREIDRTGNTSHRSSGLIDGFKGAMVGAATALGAATVAAGTAATALGFNFNSSVENAQTKLMAFMRDGDKVAKTLEWVKQEAAATQFSFTDMADAAANLTPVAKSSGLALEDLIRQAEILAALNPAEGLTGATFSLREALSGDWVSIVDRFNLPRKRINELKEQGVPAMEIITRTLKEMGIEYNLVAEQGKTTAARFDQIRDKLTMLAGAATKPIFDKVGEGLDMLNGQDFEGLEKRFSNLGQAYVDLWDLLTTGDFQGEMFGGMFEEDSGYISMILGIREAVIQLWETAKPAFEELGRAITEELYPALEKIWREAGPELKTIGTALGVVLYGLVMALALVVRGIAALIDKGTDFGNWVNDTVVKSVVVLTLAASTAKEKWEETADFFAGIPQMLSGVWNDFTTGVQDSLNGIVEWFEMLPLRVQVALGFVAGWLTSFVLIDIPNFVNGVVGWFEGLPGRIYGALMGVTASTAQGMSETKDAADEQASSLVSSVVGWFQQLPGRVGAALVGLWSAAVGAFESFKNSAIQWAANTANSIVNIFWSLPGRIANAIQEAINGARGMVDEFVKNVMSGFNAGAKRNSIGTAYSPGGMTLVGEHGPELVNLPQGSSVTQAWKTRSEGVSTGQGGISLNFYGPVSTKNDNDLERLAQRVASLIDQSGDRMARGMAG